MKTAPDQKTEAPVLDQENPIESLINKKGRPKKAKILPRHVGVFEHMAQGNSLTKSIIAMNYKPSTVRTPKAITESKSWQALMDEVLGEDMLTERHQTLLHLQKIDYFVFPKSMTDEEIKTHVESNGLKVLNVRYSDKGKLAFYVMPDAQAIAKGLDMAYKLRAKYGDEKPVAPPQTVYNLFYKPEVQTGLKAFEDTLKKEIYDESIREGEIIPSEQADAGEVAHDAGPVA